MKNYVYLGDHEFDPYTNLAIDETLLERTKSGIVYLRIYSFSAPVMILAYSESPSDLKLDYIRGQGINVARRLSAGSVMYCDQKSLCYSLIGRQENMRYPNEIHREYGGKIKDVLSKIMGCDIYIGEHFSLRTRQDATGIIAGHGIKLGSGSYLYHGIIAVQPWNLNLLNSSIVLSEEELTVIPQLPYVNMPRTVIIENLLRGLTDDKHTMTGREEFNEIILAARKLASEKHGKDHWINEGRSTEQSGGHKLFTNGGFCFCVTRGDEPLL